MARQQSNSDAQDSNVIGLKSGSVQIRNVTLAALLGNLGLFAIKLLVGIVASSMAMITDAIHSLSDMVTDIAILLGTHFGSKEPDRKHPYGHGRMETFSAALVAIILITVGCGAIYVAAMDIARNHSREFSVEVVIVAAVSIVVKEFLFHITRRVARRVHSPALSANAWHHRSDAFSSVAVFVGIISLRFGFQYGDQLAAVAVALMIIWVGVRILGDNFRELTECAVDPETLEEIRKTIESVPGITQWHKLRTRQVGREIFLDLHVLVDAKMNIKAAHEITEHLEQALHKHIPRPINIVVHVEPDLPELRHDSNL